MTPTEILEEIGLTKKGAAIYMALLELGETSVLHIAQKSGMKRPTVYITLGALQEKGLIECIPKGVKMLYQAISPDVVLKRYREKVDALDKAVPELHALMAAGPRKPRVRFYEGRKSILALYTEEIFCEGEVFALTNIQTLRGMLSCDELHGLLHIMRANSVEIQDLLDDSSEAQEYVAEKERLSLGQSRLLPPTLSLNIDLLIYGEKVAIISPKNLIAVVIEDRAISNAQKQFFEFIWQHV